MENKKFCKFCGKEIEKESIVCPHCGRQLKMIKRQEEAKEVVKPKFYAQEWFMWLMLIFFAPIGIFLMWKFNDKMQKQSKIILTVVFAILFIFILATGSSDSDTSINNTYETNKKATVEVIDFSTMTTAEIDSWCNEKKVNCAITEEYSDTVEKGNFISQSVEGSKTIYEGEKITIIFSLGKEPTMGQKNALKKAESYSKTMHMSKSGIYKQLTSEYGEGFTEEEAQYAIDNMVADWNANALEKAKSYQKAMNMSKSRIYEQLTSEYGEGFTAEEAQYAIDHLAD